ncbi:MAG TPA: hypothetical protein VFS00_12675 [Polyangiaceae bacterium]|nr:hypothetical protein [Polyangiaceae bacterium]
MNTDGALAGGQVFPFWLVELPRSTVALDLRRALLEVHRPASAPSLEASRWKLWIVDGSCDQALAFRANAAACDPAVASCSWATGNLVEIDDVVCRMRRRLD